MNGVAKQSKTAAGGGKDEIDWENARLYAQKQPGLNYVGLHVPSPYAEDMFDLAGWRKFTAEEIRSLSRANLIPYPCALEAF